MDRLLLERPEDAYEAEMLLDLAFAPGRHTLPSYQLREGVEPIRELCLIARDDYDVLVACIRYWPVKIGSEAWPALLLGPIAVHPVRQGEGLGAVLIAKTLDNATTQGWRRVILVGDEPYYNRFGFRRELARGLDYPGPVNHARILAKELVEGSMNDVRGAVNSWNLDP
ncbi:MAG: N-acetyltransferase [Pseudomonadota bacterium]